MAILNNLQISLVFILFLGVGSYTNIYAKNLGIRAEVFKVEEKNFLNYIKEKLESKKNSSIFFDKEKMQQKAKEKIDRPTSVKGIKAAKESREYLYDPSVVIENDIKDSRGNVVIKAGTRHNPLEHIILPEKLLFIDADLSSHLNWAAQQKEQGHVRVILVKGSRKLAAKYLNNQDIYFDQLGLITKKFNIKHIPAIVSQDKKYLRIKEVAL